MVIETLEVGLRTLERLLYTFTNGNRRHNNDKLCEAIPFVKLIDSTNVDIRLSSACLHLDGKIAQSAIRQILRGRQIVPFLHIVQVLFQLHRREMETIGMTDGIELLDASLLRNTQARKDFLLWS